MIPSQEESKEENNIEDDKEEEFDQICLPDNVFWKIVPSSQKETEDENAVDREDDKFDKYGLSDDILCNILEQTEQRRVWKINKMQQSTTDHNQAPSRKYRFHFFLYQQKPCPRINHFIHQEFAT